MQSSLAQRYLVPGIVFQSVVIASGYGILTWIIITIYLIPLSTIGIYKLRTHRAHAYQKI